MLSRTEAQIESNLILLTMMRSAYLICKNNLFLPEHNEQETQTMTDDKDPLFKSHLAAVYLHYKQQQQEN